MSDDNFDDDFEAEIVEDEIPTHEEVASHLEHSLEQRPSEKGMEPLFKGQKRSSLSNVLSGQAAELQKNLTADAIAHALGNNPEEKLEELSQRRGSLSNVLAGVATELEHQMTVDKVSHALETRPSEQHLEEIGLMKNKRGSLSDVLHSSAHALETSFAKDAVSQGLKRQSDLGHQNPASKRNSNLSNLLAASARDLEKNINADQVSQKLSKRASQQELIDRGVLIGKRSSVSDVLAANAKELERNIVHDQLDHRLSKRSSQQELLDRGVLKRPTSESNLLAGTAVVLEKALVSERVHGKIAERASQYVAQASSSGKSPSDKPGNEVTGGMSLKARMEAYKQAASGASPSIGPGIRERMAAYTSAAQSSSPKHEIPKPFETTSMDSPSLTEAKVESPKVTLDSPKAFDSPTSLKERMSAYQEAATGKSSPKSPLVEARSLKERMADYQQATSQTNVKKSVDISPTGSEGLFSRLSAYVGAATGSSKKDEDIEIKNDGVEE